MPSVTDLDSRIAVLVYGQRTITYTTDEFPTRNALLRLPPLEQIAVVCERYRFWMLNYAQELVQKPNAGYAALALLNSYFDMIAQLSGHATKGTSEPIKEGLRMVFAELKTESPIVDLLEKRLRNPMAHMGATSDHVILMELYEEPLVWGKFRGVKAIVINPRLWVKRISEHFEEFSSQLQDPDPKYNGLRKDFLARIAKPA
jgi:hypothetical protein